MKIPKDIALLPRYTLMSVSDIGTGKTRTTGIYEGIVGQPFCITQLIPGEPARFLIMEDAPHSYAVLCTSVVASSAILGDALIINTANSTYLFAKVGDLA